jgi:hypothetical protein
MHVSGFPTLANTAISISAVQICLFSLNRTFLQPDAHGASHQSLVKVQKLQLNSTGAVLVNNVLDSWFRSARAAMHGE